MHISEGVLSAPVLMTGAFFSLGGTVIGLKKMENKDIPKVAVLSSAFFVASLVHVPIGPSSVHLVLNGLVGILLGWMVFPSIVVALLLQALLFQFGGLTTLGINTFNMAFSALIVYYFFKSFVRSKNNLIVTVAGFLVGFFGVGIGAFLLSLSLIGTEKSFVNMSKVVFVGHIPLMVVEGIVTSFCILFFKRVKPEILEVI